MIRVINLLILMNNQFYFAFIFKTQSNVLVFAARCCASAAYAVMRCVCVRLCVCVSVTFVHSVETNKNIFEIFSP